MESTRVHAAFDAIYCCWQLASTLEESLESLGLNRVDDVPVSTVTSRH
ncbi:hypothetical protein [Paraburkholderia youngii]